MYGFVSQYFCRLSTLESSKSELEEAVSLRDSELDILRSCVAQVTKASSDDGEEDDSDQKKEQTLQALMDTAKVRCKHSFYEICFFAMPVNYINASRIGLLKPSM